MVRNMQLCKSLLAKFILHCSQAMNVTTGFYDYIFQYSFPAEGDIFGHHKCLSIRKQRNVFTLPIYQFMITILLL